MQAFWQHLLEFKKAKTIQTSELVISLRSALEVVPQIKFLGKIEEKPFQSSEAGDSTTHASFRLRILSLGKFPENISWRIVEERKEPMGSNERQRGRDSLSISSPKTVTPYKKFNIRQHTGSNLSSLHSD